MTIVGRYFCCFAILLCLAFVPQAKGQASPTKSGKLYGYPVEQYYHTTVQVPENIKTSTDPEDRVKVLLHNKMVAYEKEQKRPINSLPKNDLEDLLVRFDQEARQELGLVPASLAPAEESPAPKPAIIDGDER